MKLDVLAIGAHPDDVEVYCGGTIRTLVGQGYQVGIVDLTEGELGSRGSVAQRLTEAAEATRILGVHERVNLGIPDGGIENTKHHQLKLIAVIRQHRPDIVLIGANECRHPDHADATKLSLSALFYSGLRKVESGSGLGTGESGIGEPGSGGHDSLDPWRPSHVLHYMQAIPFEPTFVVDVSSAWQRRMEALRAYKSQFYNPEYTADETEPATFISEPGFIGFVEGRARALGYRIGADYGEGFLYHQGPVGIDDLVATFSKSRRA